MEERAAFQEMMQADPDMEAAKDDGVRVETAVFLSEAQRATPRDLDSPRRARFRGAMQQCPG